MCVVSNIGDYWKETFPEKYPWYPFPERHPTPSDYNNVSKIEFDALKKEVEALKELLKAAQKFDKQTNQPDCELEEKIAFIKKIAEFVGVDMKEVFK